MMSSVLCISWQHLALEFEVGKTKTKILYYLKSRYSQVAANTGSMDLQVINCTRNVQGNAQMNYEERVSMIILLLGSDTLC